jgi:hypothetical protein
VGLACGCNGLEGACWQAILGNLEHLAFLVSDVGLEELAEATEQGSTCPCGVSQGAKSAVIVADSTCQRRLANGFEGRQEALFLYLEVRLQMARERLEHLLPNHFRG